MLKHKLIKMMITLGLTLITTVTTVFAATYGWEQKGNDWYYKGYDGTYVTGTVPIDNMAYKFDETGKMIDSWDRLKMNKNEKTIGVGVTTVNPSQSVRNEPTIINSDGKTIVQQNTTQLSEEEFYTDVCKKSFNLINKHRKANNVAELQWSDELMESSKWKSEHMVSNNYYSHYWNGSDSRVLVKEALGIDFSGENIHCIFESKILTEDNAEIIANHLFSDWKKSSGHNANMLMTSYTEFGFGFAYGTYQGHSAVYATQQFR